MAIDFSPEKEIEKERLNREWYYNEIKKIEELIDTAMENMPYEMGYFEEKYYKTGFTDGVRLIMECVGR